ncbi:hypothetical protein HK102_013140 [Quaeritorhiza haematococci]|nr:hypothetical protein HK102_013140 [Quaeritorhiza haematococci]
MYSIIISGRYPFMGPIMFGLQCDWAITSNVLWLLFGLSIFKDVPLAPTQLTQVRTLSSTLHTLLIRSRAIGFAVHVALFSLASYFHSTQNYGPHIITLCLGLISVVLNTILIIFVNKWIVGKMIAVLRGVGGVANVSTLADSGEPGGGVAVRGEGSSSDAGVEVSATDGKSSSPLARSNDLEELATKIEMTSAFCTQILVGAVINNLAIVTWAFATYTTSQGMSWSSVVFAAGVLIFTVPGVLAAIWFHGLRTGKMHD